MAGLYTEIWTAELVKQFNQADNATFLDGIPDHSDKVNNDVIHLVDIGGDPKVLINNTTYPLSIADLKDKDIPIKLDLFETEASMIRATTLYALSYNKIKTDLEKHKNAITRGKHDKSIHALAPQENKPETPVVKTTGEPTKDGRRRMQYEDIITLKEDVDEAGIPEGDRRLVLCSNHANDLLKFDKEFRALFANHTTGRITNMAGFEIYTYLHTPYFSNVGKKRSFGSIPVAGDTKASVFFYRPRTFRAKGSINMYATEAKKDAINKMNLVSFDHRYIVLPKKLDAMGAIYSDMA